MNHPVEFVKTDGMFIMLDKDDIASIEQIRDSRIDDPEPPINKIHLKNGSSIEVVWRWLEIRKIIYN